MNIAFFGSSLVSAYWNGAATYYRGIIRALAARGHRITFYEPDAWDRQKHRDIEDPSWAKVVVYQPTESSALAQLRNARGADVIVKASGVGVLDEFLEEGVAESGGASRLSVFWDVDAPSTLDRVRNNPDDPFLRLIPKYSMVLTYGGGAPVSNAYLALGAQDCVPVYNALDPETHHPVAADSRFAGVLGFLGNRLPDREERVDEFFFKAAALSPQKQFLLGGAGWSGKAMTPNIRYFDHVYTRDHNAFNSTPQAVINISRESMARYGYSPATRVFEAAGAAACVITDEWEGIDFFFEPGTEILVAANAEDVLSHLSLPSNVTARIGQAACRRVLADHTYAQRAKQVEHLLHGSPVSALAAEAIS